MSSVLSYYKSLVATSRLQTDDSQADVVRHLADLQRGLTRRAQKFFWFRPMAMPKSLYLYGPVGGGKSMLMDMFYAQCQSVCRRRVHFHSFMRDVHAQFHQWRTQSHKALTGDPTLALVKHLAADIDLLCFDEFYVHNIADASLLERLLRGLVQAKVTIVLTSNDAPDELYSGGLNRHRFLPCIAFIKKHFTICPLKAQQDYRYKGDHQQSHWHHITSDQAREKFERYFYHLCAPHQIAASMISHKKRAMYFAQSVPGIGRIDFASLCQLPLGAEDYLLLAQHFHTLVLDDVPSFPAPRQAAALRFLTLIDVLYDAQICLIVTSKHRLPDIWAADMRDKHPNLQRLYRRARSRLEEMSRPDWNRRALSQTAPA